MRDLPTGPVLLDLARDVLLNDLLPLLPPDAHIDARLVANSMAIAEREAIAGERPAQQLRRELESFYADAALTHPAPRAGSTLSRIAAEGYPDLPRRLAHDLRAGNFESSEVLERGARDILWQLTIGKLRRANPRFLAANGFG
jgi:hypothetical protein